MSEYFPVVIHTAEYPLSLCIQVVSANGYLSELVSAQALDPHGHLIDPWKTIDGFEVESVV